ncbi:hypothetical protein [Aquitalea denitrificans]|uniref:hypothetical protein n=1 Tax=Aquitalea denitrificans TaxID=519081 RepID=UPI0013591334|nr:hypothetical protein [Aquitalea denitrificans]
MKLKWIAMSLVAAILGGCASYGHPYKDNTPDAVIQKIVAKQAEFSTKAAAGNTGAMYELAMIHR